MGFQIKKKRGTAYLLPGIESRNSVAGRISEMHISRVIAWGRVILDIRWDEGLIRRVGASHDSLVTVAHLTRLVDGEWVTSRFVDLIKYRQAISDGIAAAQKEFGYGL